VGLNSLFSNIFCFVVSIFKPTCHACPYRDLRFQGDNFHFFSIMILAFGAAILEFINDRSGRDSLRSTVRTILFHRIGAGGGTRTRKTEILSPRCLPIAITPARQRGIRFAGRKLKQPALQAASPAFDIRPSRSRCLCRLPRTCR
jgi:hypothetical protein